MPNEHIRALAVLRFQYETETELVRQIRETRKPAERARLARAVLSMISERTNEAQQTDARIDHIIEEALAAVADEPRATQKAVKTAFEAMRREIQEPRAKIEEAEQKTIAWLRTIIDSK